MNPTRRLLPFASLLLLALPAGAAKQPPAAVSAGIPGFGETMEVNIVNVDVYVTDKTGNRFELVSA